MKRPIVATVLAALVALQTGCGQHASFVQTNEAALGRVVVYRNGIAYYERRARVDGDTLALRVPADKVDDFLKSLTVVDAKTNENLPVSFPTRGVASGGHVDMTVQLPNRSHRDIILTYVTEAPAWKPSYRVVVDDAGKVDLQGWAIVDNTSGEDWQAVKVGVGSSSALSFRYDLHSIRLVHRETLRSQDNFAKAPPVGGSVVRTAEGEQQVVLAELGDTDIPRPEGHPDVAFADEESRGPAPASLGAGTRGGGGGVGSGWFSHGKAASAPAQAAPRYRVARRGDGKDKQLDDARVAALADSLKARKRTVVIEGYATAGEAEAGEKALDRANILRNQLIERGIPPAQLQVVAKGVVAGQKAGVRLVEAKEEEQKAQGGGAPIAEAPDTPVGESHFESKTAMTVGKGTSAMVSILQGKAPGEIVYLYDAEGSHGDARFAFKAVRFKNVTTSTLESGPMTVYGSGRFIGEGLTDPIPPGAIAVVPFALDRQVVVDRTGSTGDRMSRLVKLHRGVLTAEVQHLRTTKLKLTNRLGKPTTAYVRHTVAKGWNLTRNPKTAEKYGDAHLFAIELAAGETKTVEIEEATPMTRTVDLRSPVGVDLVRVYLQTAKEEPAVEAAMKRLLDLYQDMARHGERIAHLRERGDEFRVRMDELHGQIFSLKAVRTGGTLMAHLQQKMKEISQKVQDNTLAIVDHEEKLMLARVRFHDELAELTLSKPVQTAQAK